MPALWKHSCKEFLKIDSEKAIYYWEMKKQGCKCNQLKNLASKLMKIQLGSNTFMVLQ